MKTLKQAEQLTGIKADNLRQRIHRGTLKATKKGRDWLVSDTAIKGIIKMTNQHSTQKGQNAK